MSIFHLLVQQTPHKLHEKALTWVGIRNIGGIFILSNRVTSLYPVVVINIFKFEGCCEENINDKGIKKGKDHKESKAPLWS